MAIYRQAKQTATLERSSLTVLDTGELAVMPVVYVEDFDIRVPGAVVMRYGTVIDVVDLEHVRVQWIPDGDEEVVHVSKLGFMEYATLSSELEDMLCVKCSQRHHPNVICEGQK